MKAIHCKTKEQLIGAQEIMFKKGRAWNGGSKKIDIGLWNIFKEDSYLDYNNNFRYSNSYNLEAYDSMRTIISFEEFLEMEGEDEIKEGDAVYIDNEGNINKKPLINEEVKDHMKEKRKPKEGDMVEGLIETGGERIECEYMYTNKYGAPVCCKGDLSYYYNVKPFLSIRQIQETVTIEGKEYNKEDVMERIKDLDTN